MLRKKVVLLQGAKYKPNKNPADAGRNLSATCFLLVPYLAYTSPLKTNIFLRNVG
jgi:hypothetical protein